MGFLDHIKSLLRDHGRAFIPGLGGFVKEYVPARIDRSRQLFLPPTCTLSFNSSLAKEDGLLTERVAQEEGSDFEQARQKVRERAREWERELREEKRLELDGIGILYRDEEATLRFEPEPDPELESSSYGLGAFYVSPVRRMEATEVPLAEGDPAPSHIHEKPEKERKGISSWAKAAAVILPLIVLLGIGAIVRMKGSPLNAELFDLGGSGERKKALYDPRSNGTMGIRFPEADVPEDREPPFSFRLEESGRTYTVLSEEAMKKAREKEKRPKSWSLVGGCFEIRANAKGRVKELAAQGFPARILKRKRRGLHVVVFNSFADRNKALEGLQKARRSMRDAWLLHRP